MSYIRTSGRAEYIFPNSGKIYDITHADATEHSVALPAGYPENTKAILIRPYRVAGAGLFQIVSVSGGARSSIASNYSALWIRAIDGLFYYALTVVNDDWDIEGMGYITGPG